MKNQLLISVIAVHFLLAACEKKSEPEHAIDAVRGDIAAPADSVANNRPMTEAQIEHIREMQREAQARLDKLPPERREAIDQAVKRAQSMTAEERRKAVEEAESKLTPEQKKRIEDYQKKVFEELPQ